MLFGKSRKISSKISLDSEGNEPKTQVIPILENKSAFERIKAAHFDDHKQHCIDLILCCLGSSKCGSFHAAEMRTYFRELVLKFSTGAAAKRHDIKPLDVLIDLAQRQPSRAIVDRAPFPQLI